MNFQPIETDKYLGQDLGRMKSLLEKLQGFPVLCQTREGNKRIANQTPNLFVLGATSSTSARRTARSTFERNIWGRIKGLVSWFVRLNGRLRSCE